MASSTQRIIKLQTIVFALAVGLGGIALRALDTQVQQNPWLHWLNFTSWSGLGDTLIVLALAGIWFDYKTAKDQQSRTSELLGQEVKKAVPDIRDSVFEAFDFGHEALARVTNPESLDNIIRNSLALRLEDKEFAAEVYNDIRDQAVRAPERWHDARVEIHLSPLGIPRDTAKGGVFEPDQQEPLYVVTVRWEYTVVPRLHTRRFACVSDRNEYLDLMQDFDGTSAWWFTPKGDIDASSKEAFEVVQFTVDGDERPIRRAEKKGGQTYSVALGTNPDSEEPVRISYTYRTVTAERGHLLYIDIEQPTRGIEVELDYGDCDIERVSVLDLFASSRATVVERTPDSVPGRAVRVSFDGWAFPRSGVGFVWVARSR